jgi:UDP-N-acetylmuramyl-tripeptide synthetase
MRLDELIEGIESLDLRNLYSDMEVTGITNDSRNVQPGSIFVAIPGTVRDGHDYIDDALNRGATAVIQSRPLDPGRVGAFLRVREPRSVYAELCAKLAGYPASKLRVIGITGTNGKTSTALITQHLLAAGGYRPAYLGTLGLLKPGATDFSQRGLTTPDPADLQQTLQDLVDEGTTHLVMEVSSHALAQERVTGVEFAGAVFTNLSQDHYDYHSTPEEYKQAKMQLFTLHLVRSGGYAVLNGDDPVGREIRQRIAGITVIFGSSPEYNLVHWNTECRAEGLSFELVIKNGVWPQSLDPQINHIEVFCPLAGHYNVFNCLAASGVALLEGLTLQQVAKALVDFPGVPGRLQRVANPAGINVYVDYAHTPDALKNVLAALREVREEGASIITVVGCGGDRDRDKRPKMGRAAQSGSDLTIITSDNPRNEELEAIISEILAGIDPGGPRVSTETDRRKAIHLALQSAQQGDIVLIAGKGHEDYQIFKDRTIHFSDVEVAESYFANNGGKG